MIIDTPDVRPHDRLRAARRRRGHTSMRQAASSHGWSEGTYAAHECGYRPLSQAGLDRYAAALGVSASWLATGKATCPADLEAAGFLPRPGETPGARPRRGATRAAAALRRARTTCGIATPTGAARIYGWAVETYRSHESGRTPIPRRTARIYAFAYDIPAELLDATLERVQAPPRSFARRTGRAPSEVARYIDGIGRQDTHAAAAVEWILTLASPTDALDRMGGDPRRKTRRARHFRPMPRGWIESEYGVPADETAFLDARSGDQAQHESTSSILVHLRHAPASDPARLRLLVTPDAWVVTPPWRDEQEWRTLINSGNPSAGVGEPTRLPVLSIMMPASRLAHRPGRECADLDHLRSRPGR